MIEAAVFDLDGTLVRLPIDYEALFEEFKRIIRVNDVRPVVDVVSKADGKTKEVVFKAWDKAEQAVSGRITVNEAGMETYRKFISKPKAMVTLQGTTIVDAILKQFNLAFDFVVTREASLFRVDQLTKAIALLGFESKDVLFIGDTDADSAAAEKVGCHFLRVK